MSGGVDSSVAAHLLQEQGFDVVGLFMKNWHEKNDQGACTSSTDYQDALRVAEKIGIPLYSVDFSKEYQEMVFSVFLEELKQGLTPNPDILCNQKIKFHVFWDKAKTLGADLLATGHYCQTNEKGELLKGKDPQKDQSYFLHAVSSDVLKKTLFPIGSLEKSAVRALAKQLGFCVHAKKDSTGICFIGKRDFRSFVSSFIGYKPGNFVSIEKAILGKHQGSAFYTIGQRKGLEIGGPGEPWFVVGKNTEKNEVILAQGKNHPALFRSSLKAHPLFWIKDKPSFPCSLKAKIRYRQNDEPCTVTSDGETILVHFEKPQRAVTPGQSIVFYDGDTCLGGGRILHSP